MSRSLRTFLFLEEESREREYNRRNNHRVLTKQLRDISDPFNLPNRVFIKTFRLNKYVVRDLIREMEEINPLIKSRHASGIPFTLKFLAALHFYGHGSYQKPTGTHFCVSQSQASVSRSIATVNTNLLKLAGKYLKFLTTNREISTCKQNFFRDLGMSGIVGAIDGSHVAIQQPSQQNNGVLYYNRKHFYSINLQIVCDSQLRILYADASFPGSVHDSAIWQTSPLRQFLNNISPLQRCLLLGDSGYPLEPSLLTPVINATNGTKEAAYNVAHKHARNVVERTLGVLKSRFRCLCRHRVLHYSPGNAGKIIYVCLILHNICRERNVELPCDEPELEPTVNQDINSSRESEPVSNLLGQGRFTRNQYINNYF